MALAGPVTSPATGSAAPLVDPSALLRQYFPVVMKPLLKRFADPSERCREVSVTLVRWGSHAVPFLAC
jgi:hypothetical protein